MARNAIINAAELASYDQIKQTLLASGYFKDNVVTHLAAGSHTSLTLFVSHVDDHQVWVLVSLPSALDLQWML